MTLKQITNRIITSGQGATIDEALALDNSCDTDALCDAADEIRRRWAGNRVHTCSIVNARSGRCGEDCKWCAQSAHHDTGIEEYEHIDRQELLRHFHANRDRGVQRFSLVTSGRKIGPAQIGHFCRLIGELHQLGGMDLCASMGLLGRDELQQLYDAGVRRYHCNLESSRSHFARLCTTHTIDDKLQTIRLAREVGMEVCSGGIIGMGESMRDRLELVDMCARAGAVSIPVNILSPIKGTPLQDTPLLSEDEITRSIALMRFVAPRCTLHFAGGRARLSRQAVSRILRGGLNGAMIGDLLTTVGSGVDDDYQTFEQTGYTI